ncbi:MAG: hybrid sensor histidine kinase/response regulator [Bacteroidales bacterium]
MKSLFFLPIHLLSSLLIIHFDNLFSPIIMILLFITISSVVILLLFLGHYFSFVDFVKRLKYSYRRRLEDHLKRFKVLETNYQRRLSDIKVFEEELKKKSNEIVKQEDMKTLFLSDIDNEIRTPLNSVMGLASLIETEVEQNDNEICKYACSIQESCERLLRLVNNFVDLTSLETEKIDLYNEDFDVNSSLRNVKEFYAFRAYSKNISFSFSFCSVPFVYGDQKVFFKALSLILDDIVHYFSDGKISFEAQLDLFKVKIKLNFLDNKMPQHWMDKVQGLLDKEVFHQEDTKKGMDVGILLAYRLLRLIQGELCVINTEDVQRIELSVPVAKGIAKEYPLKKQSKNPRFRKPSVLIVEDDPLSRFIMSRMLDENYKISLSCSGEEAVKVISEKKKEGVLFDLVLMDINLPDGWDGIQLMHHFRSLYGEYAMVPFIAQTSYANPDRRKIIMEAGFDDFIAKPLKREKLIGSIENQLSLYS